MHLLSGLRTGRNGEVEKHAPLRISGTANCLCDNVSDEQWTRCAGKFAYFESSSYTREFRPEQSKTRRRGWITNNIHPPSVKPQLENVATKCQLTHLPPSVADFIEKNNKNPE
jgi:hypothetical protein